MFWPISSMERGFQQTKIKWFEEHITAGSAELWSDMTFILDAVVCNRAQAGQHVIKWNIMNEDNHLAETKGCHVGGHAKTNEWGQLILIDSHNIKVWKKICDLKNVEKKVHFCIRH